MTTKLASILILFAGAALSHPLMGIELNPENAEVGEQLHRVKKSSQVDDSALPLSAAPLAGDDDMAGSTKKRSSVLLDLGSSSPTTGPSEASAIPTEDKALVKPSFVEATNVEGASQPQPAVMSETKMPEESVSKSDAAPAPAEPESSADSFKKAEDTSVQFQIPQAQPNEKTDFVIAIDKPEQQEDLQNMPVLISNPMFPFPMFNSRKGSKKPSHKERRPFQEPREKIVNNGEIMKGPVFAIGIEEPKMEGSFQGISPQSLFQMLAQSDVLVAPDPAPMREGNDNDRPAFQAPQPQQPQPQGFGMRSEKSMLRQILKQQDEIKQVLSAVAERQKSLQDSLFRVETHFVLN